eukprot:CAMPEP_0176496914 /NCGR_PEP_ID=MMETSP0200_2-20121128/11442_1 /TAXON_ID=947934 /ORGANISM="Chaetoceros sp., Strain GSL56" /LENGTH=199 /DNA_ID=CAMNT_0017894887 /DNA_START=83 /DNA_END=682 /DNA_ORIENTATION=-
MMLLSLSLLCMLPSSFAFLFSSHKVHPIPSFSVPHDSSNLIKRRPNIKNYNSRTTTTTTTSTYLGCICINCSRVTDCKAYHFVESKHSQPHINASPTFLPRDGSPTIHVNIRTQRSPDEMARIWAEHVEQTKLAEEKQKQSAVAKDRDKLMGENKYDLSVKTTYEYDVVACTDYVEDMGAWVRNMPEEIRKANPNFVPT